MNNKVTKAPDEDAVKLAVYDASGSRVDVLSDEGNNGESIVWIDSSSTSISFTIGLDPDTVEGIADIQYVMESSPFEGLGERTTTKSSAPSNNRHPSPSPMVPTVPKSSAPSHNNPPSPTPNVQTAPTSLESSFIDASVGGGILCNGRRGHARGKKGHVKYELVTTQTEKPRQDVSVIISEVVAGYSEYHGPVTLTPRVLFKRKEEEPESTTTTAGEGEL